MAIWTAQIEVFEFTDQKITKASIDSLIQPMAASASLNGESDSSMLRTLVAEEPLLAGSVHS